MLPAIDTGQQGVALKEAENPELTCRQASFLTFLSRLKPEVAEQYFQKLEGNELPHGSFVWSVGALLAGRNITTGVDPKAEGYAKWLRRGDKVEAPVAERVSTSLNPAIDLDRILIIPKKSMLECGQMKTGLSQDELIRIWRAQGANVDDILASPDIQGSNLTALKKIFKPEQFVNREDLTKDHIRQAQVVIAFGGDNHLTYLSHRVGGRPILAVTSDPVYSDGALIGLTVDRMPEALVALASGRYKIEKWTRADVEINGKIVGRGTSEVYLGELWKTDMSRYSVILNGVEEKHKGSGLIIATGAGSRGWRDAEYFPDPNIHYVWSRTSPELRYLATASHKGAKPCLASRVGVIRPGDELVVVSRNDHKGVCSIDSHRYFKFQPGDRARITVSERGLNMITLG